MCIIQLIIFIDEEGRYVYIGGIGGRGKKKYFIPRKYLWIHFANSSFNCQNMRFGTSLRVRCLFPECEMQYTSGNFLNNEMSDNVNVGMWKRTTTY